MTASALIGAVSAAAEIPDEHAPTCVVTGPDKFVAHAGGADRLCRVVTAAVRARASGAHRIKVELRSASAMSATVVMANGHRLPELRTQVSDGVVNGGVVDRFAQDIANQIASTLQQQHD